MSERAALEGVLAAVGAKSPTPGGGAVAAWMGATGSALGLMVVAYSIGRRDEHDEALTRMQSVLENAKAMFLELADEDAAAYSALSEALKTPRDDPGRSEKLAPAVKRAIEAPSAAAALGLNVLRVMEELTERCNPYLRSDLATASGAVESAVRGAVWMVRANLPLAKDAALGEAASGWLASASASRERIESACA